MLTRSSLITLCVTYTLTCACTPTHASQPPQAAPTPATSLSADEPTSPPRPREPHLEQRDERWYITDLDPISTQLVLRSSLFAAVDPEHGRVAVLKVLGRGHADSHRIEVVPVCRSLKVPTPTELVGLGVEPLSPTGDARVDQCLVRVVDEVSPDSVEHHVFLDVGGGEQVKAGDEYLLLGDPVCQEGFAPLGLDTASDGRCQIAAWDGPAKNISRCDVVKRPAGDGSLERRYALFVARESPQVKHPLNDGDPR